MVDFSDGDGPLTKAELDKIAANLERGLGGPWELRRLIKAWTKQHRVLKVLFDLFIKDEHGLRYESHSIRSDNFDALKREVGMDQPEETEE